MSESANQARRWKFVVAGAVAIAAVTVAIVFWPQNNGPQPPPNSITIIENPGKLAELRNRGLAELEQNNPAQAATYFEQVVEIVPKEPAGWQNLSVARLMKAIPLSQDVSKRPQFAKAVDDAQNAIDRLSELTDSWEPKLFAARLDFLRRDRESAVTNLLAAAKTSPELVFLAYEVFDRLRDLRDQAMQIEAKKSLSRVHHLDPSNLFSTPEFLRQQVEGKDKLASRIFKDLQPLVKPYAAGIKRRNPRMDLMKATMEGAEAVEKSDWETASDAARTIANALRSSPVGQSDRRRVDRAHLLEYVALEFSPAVEKQLAPPKPTPHDVPISLKPIASQPAIADALQVRFGDLDVDERPELVVLTAKDVVVFARDNETWKEVMRVDVAGVEPRAFLLADLDFDTADNVTDDSIKDDQGKSWPKPATPFFGETTHLPQCTKADLDLIVYGKSGIRVFENVWQTGTRSRSWKDVTAKSGINERNPRLIRVADVDADGDLDVVVARETNEVQVYRNLGEFQFNHYGSGVSLPQGVSAREMIAFDFDRDIDTDFLVFSEGRSGYLENLRHGDFRWVNIDNLASGVAGDLVGTTDGEKWLALVAGANQVSATPLNVPLRSAPTVDGPLKTIINTTCRQVLGFDLDNDGYEDCCAVSDSAVNFARGRHGGHFEVFEFQGAFNKEANRLGELTSADYSDIDADGDLDFVLAGKNGVRIFENQGGEKNNSLSIAFRGAFQIRGERTATPRVNHLGIGSTVQLKAGRTFRQTSIRRGHVHFGLGKATAEVVRIIWTNGIPQNIIDPKPKELICAERVVTGSCPYLYAWNGERFVFVTDCLWGSPIGLQAAEDQLMPHREWEYLQIPSHQLKAKNGEYVLQMTEELWEAAYFDSVKLLFVDHPLGTEVFSNEKVGPPSVAQFRLHSLRRRMRAKSVFAIAGGKRKDISRAVIDEDDRYAAAFAEKKRQGIVDRHHLEINLGDVPDPSRLILFLKAWMYPSGTAVNVGLSQHPTEEKPMPPALSVADGKGGWKVVKPFMGFAGGKTKTVAFDLSGVFPAKDYRLRITTNMEFYWDAIWYASGEEPLKLTARECSLVSAHAHFRGFSRVDPHPQLGPQRYAYEAVDPSPKWPAIAGAFTRYGRVDDLLKTNDARQVVIGAGDEITLRFKAPPPAKGMARSFLLHTTGWDKDFDPNTITGTTTGPLPYPGMRVYPYARAPRMLRNPEFRSYLREYQTRYQSPEHFWRTLRYLP